MEGERIKSLDGMRAFAIIFVLLSHSLWKYKAPVTLNVGGLELQNFLYNGWLGVDLFFVLSGFLIASQLLKSPITGDNLKRFLGKRYFRIAPAYYVSVFITLIFIHILPSINETPILDLLDKWWFSFFSHIIFMHDYIGREPIIDGLFWSIPIEIKFYMILPVFIYLLTRLKKNTHRIYFVAGFYLLYIMARAAAFYAQYGFDEVKYANYFIDIKTPFHFSLDGLTIGVLCAFIFKNEKLKQIFSSKIISNIIFAIGAAIFLFIAKPIHFMNEITTFFERTAMTPLFAISFGLILIALISGCFATKFFGNMFLRFIAKISYSLYLTHMFALFLQISIIDKLREFIESTTLCWLISLPVFFVSAISIAYLLYIFVEKPFINWSRKKYKS